MVKKRVHKYFHRPFSIEHFWDRVRKTDTCWLWRAGKNAHGYGAVWDGKKAEPAHRISWRLKYGDIPKGMYVLHRCDVRICVRPSHLFLGTHSDNMTDMLQKGRQNSPKGAAVNTAKLTDEIVIAMRKRFAEGVSKGQVAREFPQVQLSTVKHILNRRYWKHLP